jgi:mono/diheme cytochrome c family protein
MKSALIVASFAMLLPATAAKAQDDRVERGRALVKEFCADCHAIGAHDESPDKTALPLRDISNSFDLDTFPQVLIRGISSDHPDMPQVKFSPRDARDVRDYLRTLQK